MTIWSVRVVVSTDKDIVDVMEIDCDVEDEVEMIKAAKSLVEHIMKIHAPSVVGWRLTYENLHQRSTTP